MTTADIIKALNEAEQDVDHASPTDDVITMRYEFAIGIHMAVTVSFSSVEWNPGRSDGGDISRQINPPEDRGWDIEGGEVTSISFAIASQDPVFYPVYVLPPAFCEAMVRIAKHHIETEDAP